MGIMFRGRPEQRGGVTRYHAPPGCPARGLLLNGHIDEPGEIVFRHMCKLGLEGIVSKRLGSPYRSGRSRYWIKSKNLKHPAVKREVEEDWGEQRWREPHQKRTIQSKTARETDEVNPVRYV